MDDLEYILMRRDSAGGSLRRGATGSDSVFRGRHRVVMLVHGYNVSEREAEASSRRFVENLRTLGPAARRLANDVVAVYWPGDARMPIIGSLIYPLRVETAIQAGPILAEHLRLIRSRWPTPVDFIVVAHSLGSRFALEAIAALEGPTDADIAKHMTLVLMAAAVPVGVVQRGGDRHDAVQRVGKRFVLFSPADWVLRAAFPIGQLGAELRNGLEAVGLKGRPGELWQQRDEMWGYGHGDYWSGLETAALVAYRLGAFSAYIRTTPLMARRLASFQPGWREPIGVSLPARSLKAW